jgi:hypothetical protein
MTIAETLHPQFVTDGQGRQTAVIIPIEEYNELLEDLEGLAAIAERAHEPTIPHEQVLQELRDNDLLSG